MGILSRLFGKRKDVKSKSEGQRRRGLEKKLKEQKVEKDRKRIQLTKAKIEIEELIHLAKPNSKQEDFTPPFHLWMEFPENQELNIEEALDQYINKYNLLRPETLDEPFDISRIAARMRILGDSQSWFNPEVSEDLNKYIISLQGSLMIHRMKWNAQKKMDTLKKNINGLDKKINESDKNSKG